MRLDADKLRAEADAHSERMQSPLWAAEGGKRDDRWTERLTVGAQLSAPSLLPLVKKRRIAPENAATGVEGAGPALFRGEELQPARVCRTRAGASERF